HSTRPPAGARLSVTAPDVAYRKRAATGISALFSRDTRLVGGPATRSDSLVSRLDAACTGTCPAYVRSALLLPIHHAGICPADRGHTPQEGSQSHLHMGSHEVGDLHVCSPAPVLDSSTGERAP